ncbi:MAG: beta-propeller domain-containing protein [Magnetococcales bacterium]|nr:beta-propeller domain-containing protein [Magnetococcales bacterium]
MFVRFLLQSAVAVSLSLLWSFQAFAGLPGAVAMGHGEGGAGAVALLDPWDSTTDEGRVRVKWSTYRDRNGETRPAWCDVDGDGADELILGLGPEGKGWIEVLDDASHDHAHLRWLRIPWRNYNRNNGETFPACGDLDADGRDELVIGLGEGSNGWFYLLDDADSNYARMDTGRLKGWKRFGWRTYNRTGGGVRPAVGNLDQDPADEIVIATGAGGKGYVQILDDSQANYAHLKWKRPGSSNYQKNDDGIWPAVCDLDGDGAGELVLGLGQNGSGWLRVFDSANNFQQKDGRGLIRGWMRLGWTTYNRRYGAVMPSCANMDSDPGEELVLTLNAKQGRGWYQVRDDLSNGLKHKQWHRLSLPDDDPNDSDQEMIHLAMRPQGQDGPGFSLTAVEDADALRDFLTQGLMDSADSQIFDDRLYMATAEMDDSSGGATVSSTNLQEVGVDEADRIKSDGQILYLLSERTPKTTDNTNTEIATASFIAPSYYTENHIRVLQLSDDPASVTELNDITIDENEQVDGLYLATQRPDNQSDMLITVGGRNANIWSHWFRPWYWQSGETEIGLYDASDPTAIQRDTHITIDGQLISSRRIGEKLYLVTRYTPTPPHFNSYAYSDEEKQSNQVIADSLTVSDLLPNLSINGEDKGDLVAPENCFMPSFSKDRPMSPDLINVVTIDLSNPEQWQAHCVLGPTETIYVSTQSLYLATTRRYYDQPRIQPMIAFDALMEPLSMVETTALHKFALTEQGPDYRGSGVVQGTLGWEVDKKPFRMSEYDGTLRIATSLGHTWNDTATTRLTLLQESEINNATLTETAHVDGIGEVGERLYSVRYVGNRAYLVTFRVTDPLYVFDLEDPFNPVQRGELHIEGYSDYLHPIGEDYLLGIGKHAVADESSSDEGGRGAWYQGVKLTLFNVADPENPTEVQSHIIGERGSQSGVLQDHHAMAWLPPTTERPGRLAIPINRHTTDPEYQWSEPGQPWYWYDWTDTSLHLFDVNIASSLDAGINAIGEITALSRDVDGSNNSTWRYIEDRALLLNDSVHFTHAGKVWSGIWGDNSEGVVGPQ